MTENCRQTSCWHLSSWPLKLSQKPKTITFIHRFELLYCIFLCIVLLLTLDTIYVYKCYGFRGAEVDMTGDAPTKFGDSFRVVFGYPAALRFLRKAFENVPFVLSSSPRLSPYYPSQLSSACRIKLDWWSSPASWTMRVCPWWPLVGRPKPCVMLAWMSGVCQHHHKQQHLHHHWFGLK